MIDNFLYLAETHSEVEGGFGLNLDILDTNLINLLILIGIIYFYGSKIVGNILSERRAKIAEQIEEAEQRRKEAVVTLAEEEKKLSEAKETASKIISDAQANAQKAKETILAQGTKEVERLKASAEADLSSEEARAIAELKQRVSTLALEKVESQLPGMLDDSAQTTLIDRSIAQLGGA
ncbi:ATP synthase subunit b [Hyella patelloides LEGE 07179]|uniref:ATP synthase subunit b n=1 Tax=Hyella patelloides LEGE 07179 TaxID=945734 RepID=A0A563VRY1_9CYAN|nr:F0F1 ATP synthase subunit B [Hyella patelloides]VEP14218.1 ATP synthase subunit b [Hyella patelloides LEGE 07179]